MIGWSFFRVLPIPQMIKLLNFHFSASNSVAVSGLEIGFQVILKKNGQKRKSHTPPLSLTND